MGRIPIAGGEGKLDSDLRLRFALRAGSGSGSGLDILEFLLPPITPSFPARFGFACCDCDGDSGDADFGGFGIEDDGAGGGGVGSLSVFFLPSITPNLPWGFFCCSSFSLGLGTDNGCGGVG